MELFVGGAGAFLVSWNFCFVLGGTSLCFSDGWGVICCWLGVFLLFCWLGVCVVLPVVGVCLFFLRSVFVFVVWSGLVFLRWFVCFVRLLGACLFFPLSLLFSL